MLTDNLQHEYPTSFHPILAEQISSKMIPAYVSFIWAENNLTHVSIFVSQKLGITICSTPKIYSLFNLVRKVARNVFYADFLARNRSRLFLPGINDHRNSQEVPFSRQVNK